ncbi:hydrogenase assembly protein HypC [Wenjunlia vitaminophila]|uniref:Hydrogenase assembly protein HypC n=1 Tax=Wenjunlia vitaminophila TaxID=76728 RepID=A0A0T6LSQ9_WENVI|nr:HypC/HybG/HupF family hydrogenase formation chaperone [Wenjunlia vitaminophila]KRV48985.1 hydrogenase assembly protein HypC [Wenjunlia vitaminophila]
MCLGIPGRVIDVHQDEGLRMGTIDFGGLRREACLTYTPTAASGDYVIVHVGFAITTVHEAEARRTLEVLRAMGDVVEGELGEPLPPSDQRAHEGPAQPRRGAGRP